MESYISIQGWFHCCSCNTFSNWDKVTIISNWKTCRSFYSLQCNRTPLAKPCLIKDQKRQVKESLLIDIGSSTQSGHVMVTWAKTLIYFLFCIPGHLVSIPSTPQTLITAYGQNSFSFPVDPFLSIFTQLHNQTDGIAGSPCIDAMNKTISYMQMPLRY